MIKEVAKHVGKKATEKLVENELNHIVGKKTTKKLKQGYDIAKGAKAIGATAVAGSAAVSAATGVSVAATSGAGIASGLAAAGSIGGMAAGPAALAVAPAYLGTKAINSLMFDTDEKNLSTQEKEARNVGQTATGVGAVIGVAGAGAATVAGGASGAAIMGTLASVGGLVGGGAIAGTAVIATAPVAIAGGIGYGIYKIFGGSK